MLAKQSWQIIRNPNCLLTQVVRGKYFKDGNFLKASIGKEFGGVFFGEGICSRKGTDGELGTKLAFISTRTPSLRVMALRSLDA